MQTVTGITELFLLTVPLTLFLSLVFRREKAKSTFERRFLIFALLMSLLADALANLLSKKAGKVFSALSLPALYLLFAAFFLFAVFAVGKEKRKISRLLLVFTVAFGVLLSALWVFSLLTEFTFPFGEGREKVAKTVFGTLCFLPLVSELAVALAAGRQLGKRSVAAFLFYCLLPMAVFPLEIAFGLPFVRASAVVSLLVNEFSIAKKEQYEYAEKARELAEKQLELNKSQTRIMISQIQPHFLYNSLATIGYVCRKDAETASRALDAFAEYLRMNLTAITSEKTIPFNRELEHIKTYLWLEKMRFEERLNTVFTIEATDFSLPALSVQPLVENAVKHGLCEKKDGGTLTVRTVEYEDSFVVQIEDDGVGFDVNRYGEDGKMHVGIANVRSRLKSMCNATLEIKSQKNKGTTATIRLPKESQ